VGWADVNGDIVGEVVKKSRTLGERRGRGRVGTTFLSMKPSCSAAEVQSCAVTPELPIPSSELSRRVSDALLFLPRGAENMRGMLILPCLDTFRPEKGADVPPFEKLKRLVFFFFSPSLVGREGKGGRE
jgi:hypothetical protein